MDVNVATPHSVNNHLNFFWFFHSPNVLGTNCKVRVIRSFGMRRTPSSVFDFCFPLRCHRSLWRCVVDGVGTIVVRGWLTDISLVVCTTGESRCSLLSGTPLRRVYRKMRAVGCRRFARNGVRTKTLFFSEDDDGACVASGRRGGLPSPCLSSDPLTRWIKIMCGGSKLRQNVGGSCVGPKLGYAVSSLHKKKFRQYSTLFLLVCPVSVPSFPGSPS